MDRETKKSRIENVVIDDGGSTAAPRRRGGSLFSSAQAGNWVSTSAGSMLSRSPHTTHTHTYAGVCVHLRLVRAILGPRRQAS